MTILRPGAPRCANAFHVEDAASGGQPLPRRRQLLQAGLALATAPTLLTIPARAAAPVTWRFATAYGEGVHHTQNARRFAADLAALGNGAPALELHTNASLKRMPEILPAIGSGEIQLGEVLMSSYAAEMPLLNLDAIPFIVRGFDDARLLWRVSRTAVEEALAQRGVRLLYAAPWPPQALLSRVPVQQLSDLKGQQFRVYNEATRRIAELAGAVPVTIAASELAAMVQAGKVDATITSSITAVDSRVWTRMKQMYDVRAWIPKNMVCVHAPTFAALPPAAQAAMREAALAAENRGWALAQAADAEAQRTLVEHRVDIALPGVELRRTLGSLGERMSREWANTAGIASAVVLLEYFRQRS